MELVRPVTQLVCFGECMAELSRTMPNGTGWALDYAGDSYNVAVYARRMGLPTAYMTAIGRDEFSDDMFRQWQNEDIDTSLVVRHPDRTVGLYAIRVDNAGERSFTYWRSHSAAREFFACPGYADALAIAARSPLFYLSGITLSLFGASDHERIMDLARAVRQNGGKVIFDTNFRQQGWRSKAEARDLFTAFGRLTDIVLPTLEDDRNLFGDVNADSCAQRWLALGAREVAVKLGPEGAHIATGAEQRQIAACAVGKVKDTTGAGDSFNAAYLVSRHYGKPPFEAAEAGALLAANVVQQSGAILPRELMPTRLTR